MGDFGELRSLLHVASPSSATFDALAAVFREADDLDEVERVWLPYALERIEAWPAELRRHVASLEDTSGEVPPWWALLVHLDIGAHRVEGEFLQELMTSSRVARLTSLIVRPKVWPEGALGWIASSRHLGRLDELTLSGARDHEGVLELAASSLRLESLRLSWCDVRDEGLAAFARGGLLSTLRSLALTHCGVGGEGVVALARGEGARPFEALDLSGNAIGGEAVAALARSGRVRGVRRLSLAGTRLDDTAVEALVEAGGLEQLTRLDLAENELTGRSAHALSAADLGALNALSLRDNAIDASGVLALMRSGTVGALNVMTATGEGEQRTPSPPPEDRSTPSEDLELELEDIGLGPEDMRVLADTRRLSGVSTLLLRRNPIGVEGGRALGRSAHVGELACLDLESCELTDAGLAGLFPSGSGSKFAELDELDLSRNDLTDASAHVFPASGLERLSCLRLHYNPIGAAWIDAFANAPVASSLSQLYVSSTSLGDAGLAAIAAARCLGSLRVLDVQRSGCGDSGVRALMCSELIGRLEHLSLMVADLEDETGLALASVDAPTLRWLFLGAQAWRIETWRAVATAPGLSALRSLSTSKTVELERAISMARDEGLALNPWTDSYMEEVDA